MASLPSSAPIRRHAFVAVLLVASGLRPAIAADEAIERERLAALDRQIELSDRLAEHAAAVSPRDRARYHFDYARLRADLQRVREGLRDYLVPQRAQPRDPVPLAGDYLCRDTGAGSCGEAVRP